jgi:hypothetical protein
VRRLAGKLFIDYRLLTELAAVALLLAGFLVAAHSGDYVSTLTKPTRASLYSSLTGTTAALLGFALTALAILVALPSTDRMEALRKHPRWPRVPGAYLRAAAALLAALVLCTLGIPLDSAKDPWRIYEAVTVALLALALVRVIGAVIALDQVLSVARQRKPRTTGQVNDPGP